MDLVSTGLEPLALWLANALYLILLLFAVSGARWRQLADSADSNIWLAVCVGVSLTWAMRASVDPGMHLHFLGAGLMALMFGWHFAVIGGAFIVLLMAASGHGDALSLGANGLIMSALPASVSYLVFLIAEWALPRNFFIYIFISAFLGGGLGMVATAFAVACFLHFGGGVDWNVLLRGYLQFNLIMAFPEGFTTGFLMTMFVVYRPQWVYTFRDSRYLIGK